jgi:H+/Cl- antiporter ClcA
MGKRPVRDRRPSRIIDALWTIGSVLTSTIAVAVVVLSLAALSGAMNVHSNTSSEVRQTFAWAVILVVPIGGAVLGIYVARRSRHRNARQRPQMTKCSSGVLSC